jgi:hypothetical protein
MAHGVKSKAKQIPLVCMFPLPEVYMVDLENSLEMMESLPEVNSLSYSKKNLICPVREHREMQPPSKIMEGGQNGVPRRGYKAPSYTVVMQGLKELIRGPLFLGKGGYTQ